MKKTILILILSAATIFCKAQSKADTVINDSIPLLSIKQVNNVISELRKVLTIDQSNLYQYIVAQFQKQIDEAIIERKKKQH